MLGPQGISPSLFLLLLCTLIITAFIRSQIVSRLALLPSLHLPYTMTSPIAGFKRHLHKPCASGRLAPFLDVMPPGPLILWKKSITIYTTHFPAQTKRLVLRGWHFNGFIVFTLRDHRLVPPCPRPTLTGMNIASSGPISYPFWTLATPVPSGI